MNSKSRVAMNKRLTAASEAKAMIKKMIVSGLTVAKIKSALQESGIPVTAYDTLREQGLVSKWRNT